MYKLPKTAAINWYKANAERYLPHAIDCACPHCERPIVTFTLNWTIGSDFYSSHGRCPGCSNNSFFLLRIRDKQNQENPSDDTDIYIDPAPVLNATYNPCLDEISQNFGVLYRQAQQAELYGLDGLVGIGYRKAMEFLLKDWIISEHQDDRKKVIDLPLAQCIDIYITDTVLKEGIKRVVWLGNDETHYNRSWPEKDIDDLKKFLQAATERIASDVEFKKLPTTMPAKPKNA